MAIADAIPKLVAARMLRQLNHTAVFAGRTNRSYEPEFAQGGNVIDIVPVSPVTVGDYDPSMDITYNDADTGTKKTITVDQDKYWAVKIDDTRRRTVRPAIIDESARSGAASLVDTVDGYIRAAMDAGSSGNMAIGTNDAPLDVAELTATESQQILQIFTAADREMTRAKVPSEGRWAIVGPYMAEIVKRITSNTNFGVPESLAGAAFQGGLIGRMANLNIYESSIVPTGDSGSNDHKVEVIQFGNDYGFGFVQLIANVERIRLESRFADGIRGLYYYGGALIESAGFFKATVTIDGEAEFA